MTFESGSKAITCADVNPMHDKRAHLILNLSWVMVRIQQEQHCRWAVKRAAFNLLLDLARMLRHAGCDAQAPITQH